MACLWACTEIAVLQIACCAVQQISSEKVPGRGYTTLLSHMALAFSAHDGMDLPHNAIHTLSVMLRCVTQIMLHRFSFVTFVSLEFVSYLTTLSGCTAF